MKLFELTIPNGDKLVGYERPKIAIKTNGKEHNLPFKKGFELLKKEFPEMKNQKFIGTLSDVTEDMAKEWGFKDEQELTDNSFGRPSLETISALAQMKIVIAEQSGIIDLSNILLILIKQN